MQRSTQFALFTIHSQSSGYAVCKKKTFRSSHVSSLCWCYNKNNNYAFSPLFQVDFFSVPAEEVWDGSWKKYQGGLDGTTNRRWSTISCMNCSIQSTFIIVLPRIIYSVRCHCFQDLVVTGKILPGFIQRLQVRPEVPGHTSIQLP